MKRRSIALLCLLVLGITAYGCGGSTTTVEHTVTQTAAAPTASSTIPVARIEEAALSSIKVTYVTSEPVPIGPGEQTPGAVACPAGQLAVGGGGYGSSIDPRQSMDASLPRKGRGSSVPNEWSAWFNNNTSSTNSFVVYAVCVSPAHAHVASSFVQH